MSNRRSHSRFKTPLKPLGLCLLVLVCGPKPESTVQGQATATGPTPPAQLPPVVVTGTNLPEGALKEDQPFGPYEQPEWTTRRRFPTTRVYVLPPLQFEFEQWWNTQWFRHGPGSFNLFQEELEVGLPYRFQLDVYENTERTRSGTFQHQAVQVEGRWALADWGKIPLNPTLYGEWQFHEDGPDVYEVRLLLGEDLSARWHWGLNLAYEQQVGGERESELAFSQGLSYTLLDEKLGLGVEMAFERSSAPNFDGRPAEEFLIGPSIQWRPTPRTHLDLVPLFGATPDSPIFEAFVVFGIDLGSSGNHTGGYVPTLLQNR